MSETSVGIIGLGNMGSAMARTCQRAGLTVFATDVTAAARARAAASGITVVETIAALVDQTQCIMLSLPSSREVSAVVEGPGGVLECAPSGTLIIDTTTADPSETRRIAQLLRVAGHDMVDAPLSGGPAGAEAGTLTIVIGGTADAQARAAQVLNAIGETLVPVGDVGAGHVAKLMNNLLVAAHLGLMREAIGAGVAAGL
ncbi:MAG: NAD(P)-dependent oxidoreductase, partial [Pseudomonadota bacterium]